MKKTALWGAIIFSVLMLALSVGITVKNNNDMKEIMTDSIRSQLTSICEAAEEIVTEYDVASFSNWQSVASNQETYNQMRERVVSLANSTGATYIYGLKEINGKYYFWLDNDNETDTLFTEYELDAVLENAFHGIAGVQLFGAADEFGSFHTAAMPIYYDGVIVGVIAADIEDTLLQQSFDASNRNIVILIAVQVAVLGLLVYFLFRLMRSVESMQNDLQRMALFDAVTGLPNRQYLINYLSSIQNQVDKAGYALIFIDMDNFKKVNDTAGHDAGDALLKRVGEFLSAQKAMSFRPTAGLLNVSARVGGDEFVQVVPGIETEEQAMTYINDMLAAFKNIDDCRYVQEYSVGMSVGAALYPYHSENYNVLIKYADIAMYSAKRMGKNRGVVYHESLFPKEEL